MAGWEWENQGGGGGAAVEADPNEVLAGPTSGSDPATVAPRPLVAGDIPPHSAAKINGGALGAVIALHSASGDPTDGAADAQIYYNTTSKKVRARENGTWVNLSELGGGSDLYPTVIYPTGVGDVLGNYTTGCQYIAIKDLTMTGIRFRRYVYGGTIECKLWADGSELATKSITIAEAGLFSVTLDSPISISAKTVFYVTTYDGGSRYARANALSWEREPPFPLPVGTKTWLLRAGMYKSSTGQPDSESSVERFPVDPIYI